MSLSPSGDPALPAQSRRRRRKRRSSSQREDPHLAAPVIPNHPLDTIIEWLLALVLAFAPFAYGSVEAWSQLVVFSLVALLALVFCTKVLLVRDVPFARTWTYLPVGLYLAWVVLQLVPLPAHYVQMVSPNTIALKTILLSDLPNSVDYLRRLTLSFYPEGARHELRIVLAASAVFIVVVNTYRNPAQIRRLLLTIIAIGAAVAVLALAQDVTHATHIFWRDRLGRGRATAGPFMTYSHYGQFMNLVIGAGLGLLLVEIHRNLPRSDDPVVSPPKPVFHRSRRLTWVIAVLISLQVITVFLSGSRGAMLGLLVALGIGVAVLSQTRGLEGKAWIAIPSVLILCAAVLLFGPSSVFDRFMTLENPGVASDRWEIVRNLTREWKQFQLAGVGLGAHEVVYPMFNHSNRLETATHAENEYAQAMEETGIVGVVLIGIFALLVWSHAARATRNSDPPIRLAGIGLGVGLLAIEIHSFSDFGQHLPPNAILAAMTCGLLVALSRQSQHQRRYHAPRHESQSASESHERHREQRPVSIWFLPPRLIVAALVVIACGWTLSGAYNAWRAESHWIVAQGMEESLAARNWDASNDYYKDLLGQAAAACAYAPGNVLYRYSLNAYRWHAISRVRDPDTNEIDASPATFAYARRICHALHHARLLCPTYSHLLLLAGEIELDVLNDPIGAQHIRTAFSLARNDQVAAGMVARCDANEEKWDQSVEHFRRYLELSGNFGAVIQTFAFDHHKPELALQLARGNIGNLRSLAGALDHLAPHISAKAREQAFEALKSEVSRDEASAELRADLAEEYVARGQYSAAIREYGGAIDRQYSNTNWHFARAKLLAHEDKIADAMHELRLCLRQNPQRNDAKELLRELSVRKPDENTPATNAPDGSILSLPTQPSGPSNVLPDNQPALLNGEAR